MYIGILSEFQVNYLSLQAKTKRFKPHGLPKTNVKMSVVKVTPDIIRRN